MIERKLVPHIRFKGLEEEWETKKLEEFSKIVGGGTPDTNKTDYWNGSINWYSPTEIGKKPYVYSSNKKITELGLKKSSAKIHPANTTILFTSRAGIGDMAILKKPAATNQGFQSIELNDNVSPYFIYSYGFMIKNKAERLASGSTFLEISKRDMKRIALKLPTLKEQKKIGDLFAKLDRLLDLQQQKLDQLELLKKALLQKLFPKKDAKIPELRFKGFVGKWKTKQMDTFVNRLDNQRAPVTASKRIPGITPYYGANGIQDFVKGYTHQGEFVLIAEDGANDLHDYPVKYVSGKIWVNNHAHVIQAKPDLADNVFVSYAFKNKKIEPYLVGGGRAKLNAEVLMKMNLKLPTLPEQQKIGNLFAKIDRLIELQNKKFDNLKQVKKSLLQNMFVE